MTYRYVEANKESITCQLCREGWPRWVDVADPSDKRHDALGFMWDCSDAAPITVMVPDTFVESFDVVV